MTTPAHRKSTSRLGAAAIPAAGIVTGLLLATLIPSTAAVAAPVTIASDTFSRTVSSGWGSATTGGAYSVARSGSTKFSVASGKGVLSDLAKGTSAAATLSKVNAGDVDVVGTIGLPKSASTLYSAFEMRSQADGSRYRGRLNVGPTGNAVLALSRVNKKTEVNLATVPLAFKVSPGAAVRVEFQAVGTSPVKIQGRAWIAGSTQPGWTLNYSDSSSSRLTGAGAVGLWQYAGSSNKSAVATTLDDVAVVKDPTAPATTPTPTPPPTSTPTQPPVTTQPTPPTPPTTVPPVTTPGEASGRGSAEVGTTSYPVPSGAIIVSPSGSDSGAGTVASPLKTVSAAVDRASSGQTIVMRGGVYNQTVTVPVNKPGLTFQSYPKEAVWFDGSQAVTSWTQHGSTWSTPWNFFPSNAIDGVANNPRYIDPAHPLAARTDMAFLNGSQMTQVANPAAVKPGTFSADPATKTVTIGSNPAGQEVRLSNVSQAFAVIAPHTTLQGFGVRRYASDSSTIGAVRLANVNETARNIQVIDTAYIGLNLSNNAGTLDHITVLRAGQLGVGINASYGFKLTNSIVDDNNYSWFKPAPVSGGVKITRSRGVTVTNNEVSGNNSSGIWCDEACYDVVIANNTAEDNQSVGIMLELSQKAIVPNNTTARQNSNIIIADTGDVRLYNNSVEAGGTFGIQLRQDARRQSDPSVPGHDPRQPNPDPTMPWITTDIVVANTAFGASKGFQFYALNAANIDVTLNGNMFNKRVSLDQSTLVAWGLKPNTSDYVHIQSPEALSASVNASWKNQQTASVLPLSAMNSVLTAAAPAIAQPLPADIAAAIGQPAGTKKIGAF